MGWQSIQTVGASACVMIIFLQKIQKMVKCTFWYRLTWVVADKVQRAVKWLCVCVKDRVPSNEFRERLGLDDIISVLQQNRLHWYGHVLRKRQLLGEECMRYEVEGARPRGRTKNTWTEVVQKYCQARKFNRKYAMERTIDDQERCEWLNVSSGTGSPG